MLCALFLKAKVCKQNKFVWKAITISVQNLNIQQEKLKTDEKISIEKEVDIVSPESLKTLFETLWKGLSVPKSHEGKESIKILKWLGKDYSEEVWSQIFDEDNQQKAERILRIFQTKTKKVSRFNKNKFKKKGGSKNNGDFIVIFKE